jgi:Tfp pilus assembly major pilin PilA
LSWLARWKRTGQTTPRAPKGVFWAIFFIVPLVIGILAAFSIPAYQDYLIRSQVAEGFVLSDGAKTALAEYYSNNGSLPADNAAAGLAPGTAISGKYVSSVDVSGGRITVAYDMAAASATIRDKVLILTPTAEQGTMAWICTSTLPDRDLPTNCRRQAP